MTLWDLLTALCLVMPTAGALATVKDIPRGFAGYIVAITVGLILGVGCAWAMRTLGNRFAVRSTPTPDSENTWRFRALYTGAVLWIIVALFLGSWITEAVLRLI
jgi:hypothetical protein